MLDLLISGVGALVVEYLLILVMNFIPVEGQQIGAPIAVGTVSWDLLTSGQTYPFAAAFLIANVVLTGAPFWLVGRRLGRGALVAGIVGVLLGVAITVYSYSRLDSGLMFAGFPLPIATAGDRIVSRVWLWVDCMFFGGVMVAVWSILRQLLGRTSNTGHGA